MNILSIIPNGMGSSRFPESLMNLLNKPMIGYAFERVLNVNC